MRDKKFEIIVCILILIIICLTIKIFVLLNRTKLVLKGEKLNNFIYHYQIDKDEDQYLPMIIYDKSIYYLIQNDYTFTLYKRSIYSDKIEKIGSMKEENEYCTFVDNYISCTDEEYNHNYYDYKLKLLYSTSHDKDAVSSTIYYQGRFLELKGNKLYENDNLFKELKFDYEDANFNSDIVIGNNTYLIFYLYNTRSYLYYDILNDKYSIQENVHFIRYDDGFYTIRVDEILIYDVLHDENRDYSSLMLDENCYVYALKDDKFYFVENNGIFSIDLKNKLVEKIEYKFDKSITQILCDDDYIYLISSDDEFNIYIIDIKNSNKETFTIDEFKEYMDTNIDKRVVSMEEKYHINIVYKDEVEIDNETFSANKMTNDFVIWNALDDLEYVMDKFNVEFFDKFYDNDYKGLFVYLTGPLIPNPDANTSSNPVGYTMYKDDQYEIVVDINHSGLEATICHELMHNIEYKIDDFPYNDWYKLNPKNFSYARSYISSVSDKYTMYEDDKDKVYFVDSYSKTYTTEDIARIFENICSVDSDSRLLSYPNLYKKAIYLKELLQKEYPSLKDSTVFNSLN